MCLLNWFRCNNMPLVGIKFLVKHNGGWHIVGRNQLQFTSHNKSIVENKDYLIRVDLAYDSNCTTPWPVMSQLEMLVLVDNSQLVVFNIRFKSHCGQSSCHPSLGWLRVQSCALLALMDVVRMFFGMMKSLGVSGSGRGSKMA